ncbi:ISC system 2Fe-2S type ferredoxin [Streptacidiphilus sp. PAMC 29251]
MILCTRGLEALCAAPSSHLRATVSFRKVSCHAADRRSPHPTRCPDGAVIEATRGQSVCAALLQHDIEIEHACEMSFACTTCHVVVREGFASLGELDDKEEDLLGMAWGLEATSRLSCQALIREEDLVVEIPKYTINHASENS